ncbi:MAG: undecaprenyldiphospho-muramoylpentapeptide beta-N-acetylglucosaminyltransferase [Myxococcota bacterium]
MKVIIAGGGTGGHLYPGIALADEFKARGGEVMFVGTERGIETRAVPKAGYPLKLIDVSGIKRVGLVKTLSSLGKLPVSFFQCQAIISEFKPDVVVGVGGYASGPMVMVARTRGLTTAVLEQNSIPGVTNKILGKVVHKIFGSFEASAKFFPTHKFVRAGNPVRHALISAPAGQGTGILVLGGSQGARALNQVLPEALAYAFTQVPAVPVTHQTGEKDVEETKAAYARAGVTADVRPFIDDMAKAYADAKLCVCRAGATTCAELTALGRPSILIPFPQAADDHQTHNARELEQAGAAVLMAQSAATGETLGKVIVDLLKDEAKLKAMGEAARKLGRPHAAREIADALQNLAGVPTTTAQEVRS